ncbi:MAG: hypothetical protein H0W46_05640 [Acidimicrobiia bacterium]|nr:hypothetical protein [Acidimicrobiia bacterium]
MTMSRNVHVPAEQLEADIRSGVIDTVTSPSPITKVASTASAPTASSRWTPSSTGRRELRLPDRLRSRRRADPGFTSASYDQGYGDGPGSTFFTQSNFNFTGR